LIERKKFQGTLHISHNWKDMLRRSLDRITYYLSKGVQKGMKRAKKIHSIAQIINFTFPKGDRQRL